MVCTIVRCTYYASLALKSTVADAHIRQPYAVASAEWLFYSFVHRIVVVKKWKKKKGSERKKAHDTFNTHLDRFSLLSRVQHTLNVCTTHNQMRMQKKNGEKKIKHKQQPQQQ